MLLAIRRAVFAHLAWARAVVFICSFCLMVLEIVAGRVVAPYLGVSLYTWTSVIGTILLGVTLGNYIGGVLADRQSSSRVLGLTIAAAGIATLCANLVAPMVGPWVTHASAPFWFTTLEFCVLVFFPAAFLLSMVSPQVIKFHLRDLQRAGITVGTIGAWSALGSILGTFATGFIFIMYVGTKALITSIAIGLIVLGVLVAWQEKIWRSKAIGLVAMALVGNLLVPPMCQRETNYYCIRLHAQTNDRGHVAYTLLLDHLVHSYTTPAEPDAMGYDYEQIHAGLVAYHATSTQPLSALVIGGGGYTIPRYLEAVYPQANVEVAEIDPEVTRFNQQAMELPTNTRIQSHHGDARMFLARLPADKKYDIVFGDAVNDFAVPYQITTLEFQTILKRHLAADGLYALTIIDDPKYARFSAALVRTLRQSFSHVAFFPMGSDLLAGSGRNTFEIVASDVALEPARWLATRPVVLPGTPVLAPAQWQRMASFLSEQELQTFLAAHPTPILRDDFAPTDNYLAPVFATAYQVK